MADPFDAVSQGVPATLDDPFDAVSAPAINFDELSRPSVNAPHGIFNAIWSGVQSSATGLALRGELPSQELPPDSTTAERLAAGVSGIVVDLPQILFGAAGGMAAGTAALGPVGTVAGAAAGGFAVPSAMRAYLMQAYKTGGVRSFGDLWEASKAFAHGTVEGVTMGLGTAGPGMVASKLTNVAVRAAAVPLAEVLGMTSTAAALEQRMPTLREFQDNALLIGGFRAVPVVQAKLQDIYAKSGLEPARVAYDASFDAKLSRELLDPKADVIPEKYADLVARENAKLAVPDPVPMTKAERERAAKFVQDPFAEPGNAPGEKTLPNEVNYNYINSTQDAAGAIARLSQLNRDKIVASRRSTVSWEQTNNETRAELARVLNVGVEKVNVDKAIPPEELAVQLKVRLHLARGAAEALVIKGRELAALGERASELQVADMLDATNRTSMLISDFLGLRAEVARAQNSLKDRSRVDINLDQMAKVLETGGGRAGLTDLARVLSEADSPASALRAVKRHVKRTKFQTVVEVWKASVLSGLTTFEANLLGNMNMAMSIPERAVTAAVGKISDMAGKAWANATGKEYVPETRASFYEAAAVANGMIGGSLAGLKMAGAVIRSRAKERAAQVKAESLRLATIQARAEGKEIGTPELEARVTELVEKPDATTAVKLQEFEAKVQSLQDKIEHAPPAEPGTAMHVVQTPFRVLSATDALFRTMAEQGEAHALATRDALAEGFQHGTKEFNTRVNDILLDPSPERITVIQAAGHRGVYTTKLGPKGRALQELVKNTPLEFVVPFIRTPINLMKWSASYLPGVNLFLAADRAALRSGGVARDQVMARLIIGGAIVSAVTTAVANGNMTGGGYHLDEASRAARRAAGLQDYSIKLNGKWYSYARIQPIATVVGVAADYQELSHAFAGGKRDLEMVGSVVAATGNALISQQYLQGLSNLVNAISDPGRYGGRFMDQYAASLVPGLIGQTAAAMDPHSREINSIADAVQARIPIWREELLAVRNPITGEPILPEKSWPLSPIKVTIESSDKVLSEAARLEIPISSAPRSVHIGARTGKIGTVDIEDKARNEYVKAQGEFAHRIMSEVVNAPTWDERPDFLKRILYSKVLTAARRHAIMIALPPEARELEIYRIAHEVAAELEK